MLARASLALVSSLTLPLLIVLGGDGRGFVRAQADPAQYVDQFIGTANGGHVFAGATLPFGAVKAVADCDSGDAQGGFVSDGSPILGISPLHDDGTGGGKSLGNFKLMPMYCDLLAPSGSANRCNTTLEQRDTPRVEGSQSASPGYFSLGLETGITTEVTVTQHVALHRFTFHRDLTPSSSTNASSPSASAAGSRRMEGHRPGEARHGRRGLVRARYPSASDVSGLASSTLGHSASSSSQPAPKSGPVLLLDLTNDLSRSFQGDGTLNIQLQQEKSGQNATTSGTDANGRGQTARITGSGRFTPSFGEGTYEVFFCLDAPGVTLAGTYANRSINVGQDVLVAQNPATEYGALLSISPAYLQSHNSSLPVRQAISWTSTSQACAFAEAEVPSFDTPEQFDKVKSAARARWNKVLGTVQVGLEGVTPERVTDFWTSLYRTYISPYNLTGDNPLWQSSEPFYDSYYCIWDSFRVVHPLWAITQPDTQAEVIRALIDVYRHTGFLPDCRMSLDKGFTQGGSNADSLLADSFVKGISAGIDWETGFEAIKKDANVEPPNWGVEGRGGIQSRAKLGYVPVDDNTDPPGVGTKGRSASRTLEYSYNDFSIALVAQGLGHSADYAHYTNASGDWYNLWNPNTTNSGFSGFIQPRYADGTWDHVDPRFCSPVLGHTSCYLNPQGGEFYEASSWQYSTYVPHDMARLITLAGGNETFVKRLDALWDNHYADIGDEPAFLPLFLYNYAGQPAKTVDRVLNVIDGGFNTSVNGLPGNDDSGAMGALVVFSSLGFFPVAGQSVYLLSTPFFPSLTFTNSVTGTTARFTTINFDGASTNKYIQSVKINGTDYTRNWISHDIFRYGGTVEITLGPHPSQTWGTSPADLPPSLSTGGNFAGGH